VQRQTPETRSAHRPGGKTECRYRPAAARSSATAAGMGERKGGGTGSVDPADRGPADRPGDANASRAESQWQIYRDLFAPVEARMVKDANEYDTPERKERMAAEAAADIARGYHGALESSQRAMERLGVNPNSGRFRHCPATSAWGLPGIPPGR